MAALAFAAAIAVVSAADFLSCAAAALIIVVFPAAVATVAVVTAAAAAVIFSFETIAHNVFILRFFRRVKEFRSSRKTRAPSLSLYVSLARMFVYIV